MTDEDLIPALNALLAAQTHDAQRAVLEAQASLLLTERAEERLAWETEHCNVPEKRKSLADLASLLQNCRECGVETTFKRLALQALERLVVSMATKFEPEELAELLRESPNFRTNLSEPADRLDIIVANAAACRTFLLNVRREGVPPQPPTMEAPKTDIPLEQLWQRLIDIEDSGELVSTDEIISSTDRLLQAPPDLFSPSELADIQFFRARALVHHAERQWGQRARDGLTAAVAAFDASLELSSGENHRKAHDRALAGQAVALTCRAERNTGQVAIDDLDRALAILDQLLADLDADRDQDRYVQIQFARSRALRQRADKASREYEVPVITGGSADAELFHRAQQRSSPRNTDYLAASIAEHDAALEL